MDPADQQFAGGIDIRSMTQRASDDRLNDRKDVLDPVVEFIDDGGQTPLEPDPHLDFPAQSQVITRHSRTGHRRPTSRPVRWRPPPPRSATRASSRWSWRNTRATSHALQTKPSG